MQTENFTTIIGKNYILNVNENESFIGKNNISIPLCKSFHILIKLNVNTFYVSQK